MKLELKKADSQDFLLKDEIVTSESARRMLGYIVPIYDFDRIMLTVFQTVGVEVDELWDWVREIRLQAFPQTATWGLKYWEQRFRLPVNESMPIEERRKRIIVWMNTEWPVTRKRMETIVTEAAGVPAEVIENVAPYTFMVVLDWNTDAPLDLVSVRDVIEETKPAHLAFRFAAQNSVSVQICTRSDTYQTKFSYCGTFLSGQRPGGVY